MRVVVTGAAGRIGARLCGKLADHGHDVVGADRVKLSSPPHGWRFEHADISDQAATTELLRDHRADGVVHLAGNPHESSLREALNSHVLLTQTVLHAMNSAGTRRLVYASSNHAVGFLPKTDGLAPSGTRPRPDTYYGTANAAAEALVSLWVDRYDIEAVCVRIGSVAEKPTSRHLMALWLSPSDTARLMNACLTAADVRYEVIFGMSANTRGWFDLGPAMALGYQPQDDSERFAAEIEALPDDDQAQRERQFIGGHFTAPEFFWENRSDDTRAKEE